MYEIFIWLLFIFGGVIIFLLSLNKQLKTLDVSWPVLIYATLTYAALLMMYIQSDYRYLLAVAIGVIALISAVKADTELRKFVAEELQNSLDLYMKMNDDYAAKTKAKEKEKLTKKKK